MSIGNCSNSIGINLVPEAGIWCRLCMRQNRWISFIDSFHHSLNSKPLSNHFLVLLASSLFLLMATLSSPPIFIRSLNFSFRYFYSSAISLIFSFSSSSRARLRLTNELLTDIPDCAPLSPSFSKSQTF